jgi:hypothetical protein
MQEGEYLGGRGKRLKGEKGKGFGEHSIFSPFSLFPFPPYLKTLFFFPEAATSR